MLRVVEGLLALLVVSVVDVSCTEIRYTSNLIAATTRFQVSSIKGSVGDVKGETFEVTLAGPHTVVVDNVNWNWPGTEIESVTVTALLGGLLILPINLTVEVPNATGGWDFFWASPGSYEATFVLATTVTYQRSNPVPPTAVPTPLPSTGVPDTISPTSIPQQTGVPSTVVPTTPSPSTVVPQTSSPSQQPVDLTLGPTTVPVVESVVPAPSDAPLTPHPSGGGRDDVNSSAAPTASPSTGTMIVDPGGGGDDTQPPSPYEGIVPVIPATTSDAGVGVAVAAALVGGASAGSSMRLIIVTGGCQLDGSRSLPFMFNPTQLIIDNSEPAGALTANISILIATTVLLCLLAKILRRLAPKSTSFFNANDPEGFLRFPSGPLFLSQWFYQGVGLSGFLSIFYPSSAGGVVLGVVGVCFCVCLPVVVCNITSKSVPVRGFYKSIIPSPKPFQYLLGRGEWVSRFRDDDWVQKHASIVRRFESDRTFFFIIDSAVQLSIAAIGALQTPSYTACGHTRIASCFILMLYILSIAYVKPYVRARDFVLEIATSGMQSAGLLLSAMSFYKVPKNGRFRESSLSSTSEYLFLVATIVVGIGILVELVSEGYVFCTSRRKLLQEQVWSGQSAEPPSFVNFNDDRATTLESITGSLIPLQTPINPDMELNSMQDETPVEISL